MKFWTKNMIALLLGLGSCTGSYYIGKSSFNKIIFWESTYANLSSPNSSRRVASFIRDGKQYTVRAYVDKKETSSRIKMIFPSADPSQAEVLSYSKLLLFPLVTVIAGLALIAAGLFSIKHKLFGSKNPTVANEGALTEMAKYASKERGQS